MLWRPAARLITGPLAFLLAGVFDITVFVLGSVIRRCWLRGRRQLPWSR